MFILYDTSQFKMAIQRIYRARFQEAFGCHHDQAKMGQETTRRPRNEAKRSLRLPRGSVNLDCPFINIVTHGYASARPLPRLSALFCRLRRRGRGEAEQKSVCCACCDGACTMTPRKYISLSQDFTPHFPFLNDENNSAPPLSVS